MPKTATAADQRRVLTALSQQPAAFMLGLSPRTLRDSDAPRTDSGNYDGRELVKWATGRIKRPDLADEHIERIMVAVDEVIGDLFGYAGLLSTLNELQNEYGDGGPLAFVEHLVVALRAEVEHHPVAAKPLTAGGLAGLVEAAQRQHDAAAARTLLRLAVVCEDCGKLRRGRSWVAETPPAGFDIRKDLCPACERKAAK